MAAAKAVGYILIVGVVLFLVFLVYLPRAEAADGRIVSGRASTYGEGYDGLLALPNGPGHRVKICSYRSGLHLCITGTSNDTGPKPSTGKIADLDIPTFEYLCGCEGRWREVGVIEVTVEYLSLATRPSITLPPTDTE